MYMCTVLFVLCQARPRLLQNHNDSTSTILTRKAMDDVDLAKLHGKNPHYVVDIMFDIVTLMQ